VFSTIIILAASLLCAKHGDDVAFGWQALPGEDSVLILGKIMATILPAVLGNLHMLLLSSLDV
jgi:hypothetical protein